MYRDLDNAFSVFVEDYFDDPVLWHGDRTAYDPDGGIRKLSLGKQPHKDFASCSPDSKPEYVTRCKVRNRRKIEPPTPPV